MQSDREEQDIIPFEEDDQRVKVNVYNEGKQSFEKIPIVVRNAKSGWPLVQVSFFTPVEGVPELAYTQALGGAKCHDFFIGAFSFAMLLSRLAGRSEIKAINEKFSEKKFFNLHNINFYLDHFSFTHLETGITVTVQAVLHGFKGLEIKFPGDDKHILQNALAGIFGFAVSNNTKIVDISGHADLRYTDKQIHDAINHEAAIFHNGQIFVDLGCFVRSRVDDYEIQAQLRNIFKVDEFNKLKEDPKFKPAPRMDKNPVYVPWLKDLTDFQPGYLHFMQPSGSNFFISRHTRDKIVSKLEKYIKSHDKFKVNEPELTFFSKPSTEDMPKLKMLIAANLKLALYNDSSYQGMSVILQKALSNNKQLIEHIIKNSSASSNPSSKQDAKKQTDLEETIRGMQEILEKECKEYKRNPDAKKFKP